MAKIDPKYLVLARHATNEEGMVLVTALLMLVVLTLMGVAAMSIRNTEQVITSNNEVYQNNFYAVEAVTLEGVAAIETMPDATLNNPATYPMWLRLKNAAIKLESSIQWTTSGLITPSSTTLSAGVTNITPSGYGAGDQISYAAIANGIASGSSATYGSGSGGTTKQERAFDVYGMYDVKPGVGKSYHGKMMLVVGYKKQVDIP